MQILDLLSVVDILNWVRDNAGMEIALFIIVLAVLVAVPAWIICHSRKQKDQAENKPQLLNGTQANQTAQPPNNNSGVNIQNVTNSTIKVEINKAEETSSSTHESGPALPEKRAWRELMSGTERIEQAAGFRAAGPIYYTPGLYPRCYIMHASARVFRPGGEEYYDAKGETQYILLQHDAPGDMPYRVRPHGLTDLEALYKRAADSNASCD